jgi:prevent-host-death family protein
LTAPVQNDTYITVKTTYSVSEAQSQLPRLLKEAEAGGPISIRRHDETVAFLVSRERMDAIVETLEILGNRVAMRAIDQHRAGKTKFAPLKALDEAEE